MGDFNAHFTQTDDTMHSYHKKINRNQNKTKSNSNGKLSKDFNTKLTY